jgi:hypothetical protein
MRRVPVSRIALEAQVQACIIGAGPGGFRPDPPRLRRGLQCFFSGLHVPVGKDWKVCMLRLDGRHANAKVLIIIKTAALYDSNRNGKFWKI